jgi:hypothetical protein
MYDPPWGLDVNQMDEYLKLLKEHPFDESSGN